MEGNEENNPANDGGKRKGPLSRLTINEYLTLFVGIGSLVVSYMTYRNSTDTSDIKSAVSGLAELAAQTKRQADGQAEQLKAVQAQLEEAKLQTGAIASQTESIKQSSAEASRQTSVMLSDQRPWLQVELSAGGPMRLGNDFATMPINVSIKNVGKTPAFNVRSYVFSYAAYPTRGDMLPGMTKYCNKQKSEPLDNPNRGDIIFPGSKISSDDGHSLVSPAVGIIGEDIKRAKYGGVNKKFLSIVVYQCVTYSLANSGERHQTGSIFQLAKIVPGENGIKLYSMDLEIGESIPANSIAFLRGPRNSWQTD